MQKIPYVLVLGDEEQNTGNVSVRAFKQDGLQGFPVKSFIDKVLEEILEKHLPQNL